MSGSNLLPALPEDLVAVGAMALLMVGVFQRQDATRLLTWAGVALLAVAAVVMRAAPEAAFGGMFINDAFAVFMKRLVLLGAALGLVMSLDFNERERVARFEFPILILFATTGMMLMVSANDLISLYLGLELQSLALYVVAAFQRDSVRSTEAGLKYFVLGALSSGLLLYGASLVYGFAGTTSFSGIATVLQQGEPLPMGIVFGIVFVAAGLAFKVSAVPFHMWTPDVYEGAPTPVTAFFSIAPKVAAIALLVRVFAEPFYGAVDAWRQIIIVVAVLSMALGAFAAIWQVNIKRLMAYSSIGHIGYALVGLAAGNQAGVEAVLVYIAIYVFMNAAAFAVILAMRRDGKAVERIDDLAGLARTQPVVAAALAVAMFAMAGIPPLSGFFGKLYVFMAAVQAGQYALAVFGVLASVVGAYYYIRIVKIMYFDEAGQPLDRPMAPSLSLVLTVGSLFTLLFFLLPSPLVAAAAQAAASLFPGPMTPLMPATPAAHQGWTVIRLGAVGSTNDEAKRRAREGAPHGTVVMASEQTTGRGRDGRTWASPPGNLYASLILRPQVELRDAAALSFAAAVALGDGLDLMVPLDTTIAFKWPNDVLVNGRKIAGILLEAESSGTALEFLVIGLGVNCASHPPSDTKASDTKDSATPATSLKAVVGTAPVPEAVLDAFLGEFAAWYARWRAAGLAPLREAWLARAAGLGETLRVRTARETLHGRFAGLDPNGAMILLTAAGERRIAAGDVYFADR